MHLRMSELLREWGCNLEKGGRELIVRSTTVRHSYSHVFQFNQHTYLWRLSSSFNTSVMKFTPSLHLIAPGLLRFDHPTLVQTVFDHPVFPSRLHLNTAVNCVSGSPHLRGPRSGCVNISACEAETRSKPNDPPSVRLHDKASNKVTTSCRDCAADVTAEPKWRGRPIGRSCESEHSFEFFWPGAHHHFF